MHEKRTFYQLASLIIFFLMITSTNAQVPAMAITHSLDQGAVDPITFTISIPRILSTIDNTEISDKEGLSRSQIYRDINEYKLLLQPTRLSIISILQQYTQITAGELRVELDISWGILRQNLETLEKNGYLEIESKFVDNRPTRVISILPKAIMDFNELNKILSHFF